MLLLFGHVVVLRALDGRVALGGVSRCYTGGISGGAGDVNGRTSQQQHPHLCSLKFSPILSSSGISRQTAFSLLLHDRLFYPSRCLFVLHVGGTMAHSTVD